MPTMDSCPVFIHITGWTNVNHLYFSDGIAIASHEGLLILREKQLLYHLRNTNELRL